MYKNITLELSLKPFKKTESEYIKNVCKEIFLQWKPLIKNAEVIKFLLWVADGSEILDYKGNLDEKFEWAYFIGGANSKETYPVDVDPEGVALHSRNYLYMENPPEMTYQKLKEIINELKGAGRRMFPDKEFLVGATFDPGPEFAKSDFKYNRHNEICTGNDMGKGTMVCAYEKLHSDNVNYATYPNGIPEGTEVGRFLGKQANAFMQDMGFDYIWLSNGFGFGRETWSTIGALFDGKNFDAELIEDIKNDVIHFWKVFREECKDFPIETRGTNMSMGIDFATDGVPLKEIYDGVENLSIPPNSPWAALDGDFGLELMGHMSRIAYLNGEEYLFRFYLHDPWWANSPWYDRYNSLPHDIYLPMSLSRIDGEGKVKAASNLNILTIDNSYGNMPDSCVNEVIPHLLKAEKDSPDEPAMVVWVYPFEEYNKSTEEWELEKMFFEDWYIRGAINNGLPVSTVVTTTNFVKHNKEIYSASVLVTPVPQKDSEFEKSIIEYAKNGGKVIFYGSTWHASDRFKSFIHVETSKDAIDGEFQIDIDQNIKEFIKHNPLLCGGGIYEKATDDCAFIKNGEVALGTVPMENVVWLRGTVSADYVPYSKLLVPHNREKYFIAESLMVKALGKLGYKVEFEKDREASPPVIMIHRSNNAYIFSVYSKSTTVKTKLKFDLGAPIIDGYDAKMEDGFSTYHFPKAEHRECRVFVEQQSGTVSCSEKEPVSALFRRRICIKGLKNATVRVLAEEYCKNNVDAKLNSIGAFYCVGDEFESEYIIKDNLTFLEIRNVTGELIISMPTKGERK